MNHEEQKAFHATIQKHRFFIAAESARYTARWLTLNGKAKVVKEVAGVCHSQLCYGGDGRKVIANFMQVYYDSMNGDGRWNDTTNEDKVLYLDWLLNRSPYASTFITKSAYEVLNLGYCLTDCDTPSNLMAAGLVASRRMWEYTYILRVWVDLVKAGVNENLAYYLAHLSQCSVKNPTKIGWNNAMYGHCSIDSHKWGEKSLKNFINNKPKYLNPLYTKKPSYTGYGCMFGDDVKPLCSWVDDNFPYQSEKKVGNNNPFAAAKRNMHQEKTIAYAEGIKRMAVFAEKILEKVNA